VIFYHKTFVTAQKFSKGNFTGYDVHISRLVPPFPTNYICIKASNTIKKFIMHERKVGNLGADVGYRQLERGREIK
jgi:hypothetical protein